MQKDEALVLTRSKNVEVLYDSPPVIRDLAAEAGVQVNGDAAWDIQVFDERVYSLIPGMFEHVGSKNPATYFDTMHRVLTDDGLFLLHSIGNYITSPKTDAWIGKYIFPNGKLPSAKEITSSLEGRFLIEDRHDFAADYDRTLMAWWENFDKAWPSLEEKYGMRFTACGNIICCAAQASSAPARDNSGSSF